MKYLILFIILFSTVTIAQWDNPSGYTSELGLRMYDLDDEAGPDSLNQNLQDIDDHAKATNDTIATIKADLYNAINYSGILKNDVVGLNQLNTELDTGLVKTTGTDYIYGWRYFLGSFTYTKHHYPYVTDQSFMGNSGKRWLYGWFKNLVIENMYINDPTDTSSRVGFTYDGNKVSLDSPMELSELNITTNFEMDSSASLRSLKIEGLTSTISNTADSVIILDSLMSNVRLILPGAVSKGIEDITMPGAAIGHILILYTTDTGDSVYFPTTQADGHIYNGEAFWLTRNQNAAFMYIYDQPALKYYWMALWVRKN